MRVRTDRVVFILRKSLGFEVDGVTVMLAVDYLVGNVRSIKFAVYKIDIELFQIMKRMRVTHVAWRIFH
jgi:acid phosphatase class B